MTKEEEMKANFWGDLWRFAVIVVFVACCYTAYIYLIKIGVF